MAKKAAKKTVKALTTKRVKRETVELRVSFKIMPGVTKKQSRIFLATMLAEAGGGYWDAKSVKVQFI